MSVVALSSKVGASSSSFLGHDKPQLQTKIYQGDKVYQGASGQAALTQTAATSLFSSPKIEASGPIEPLLSSATGEAGRASLLSFKSVASIHSPVLVTENASAVSKLSDSDTGISDLTIPSRSNALSVDTFLPNAALHSDSASFSLLTGPRSIAGMREGQIATPNSAAVTPSVTLGAQYAPSIDAADVAAFEPLITSFTGIGIGGNSSTTGASSLSLSPMDGVFSQVSEPISSDIVIKPDVFAGISREEIRGNNAAVSGINSSAPNEPPLTPVEQQPNNAEQNTEQKSVQDQFNSVFGKSVNGEKDVKAQQDKAAQAEAIREQEEKQQALAAIFAKQNSQARVNAQGGDDSQNTTQTQSSPLAQEKHQQTEEQEAVKQQEAQVATLKSRDIEVKAHEHAHATVGGQYAQSPSFKYQKGADGQRYAIDGEVQIDVSAVPGDPQATINKMKQVYAAAMAPVDPSSADIRVATEALKKMDEAKALLAEERQKQIVDQETVQTLIGADAQIDELPPLKEHTIRVAGEVDASGNIAQPQDSASAPVTEVVDKIKQTIAEQISSPKAIEDGVITDSVEPPMATLAFNATQSQNNRAALHSLEASPVQMDSGASRFYTSVGYQKAHFLDVSA
ncbi:putative metalloprotease CJM1_0395 family protein [Shewanella sp. CG12_big_fil_rev_8_21_14_0_65_47_15]|uniref:putative metalloprotease CJM1_0395 family protein n=1 Tax=Shewanella sp. CG12_big_fil_rev_8_21_14_0_65_47_15 TaxID=1975537 RepID=UPI000CC8CA72|nr:putative metalloprotease CJM1_0395 family protein [Shewanella sp. CG12_big_fil_rev_8_21_14_0_65_47_15]PIW58652.1 MAG: catalase [Shewanella sp. CG12_big_fil_rev_8_21_14_0_65_47_15]